MSTQPQMHGKALICGIRFTRLASVSHRSLTTYEPRGVVPRVAGGQKVAGSNPVAPIGREAANREERVERRKQSQAANAVPTKVPGLQQCPLSSVYSPLSAFSVRLPFQRHKQRLVGGAFHAPLSLHTGFRDAIRRREPAGLPKVVDFADAVLARTEHFPAATDSSPTKPTPAPSEIRSNPPSVTDIGQQNCTGAPDANPNMTRSHTTLLHVRSSAHPVLLRATAPLATRFGRVIVVASATGRWPTDCPGSPVSSNSVTHAHEMPVQGD